MAERRQIVTEDQRAEFIPNYRPFRDKVPIPTADICAYPSVSYCINVEWRKLLIGALQSLDQPDVWDSDDDVEIFNARQQIRSFLSMAAPLCLPASTSGASSCGCGAVYLNQLRDIFDTGGLDGLAPDRPDVFFDDDSGDDDVELARRRIALCWATHDFITQVAKDGFLQQTLIEPLFPLLGASLAFLGLPYVGVTFNAVTTGLIALMNQFISGEEDIDLVACCMFDGMTGQTVTQANFAASLDACPDLGDAGANALRNLTRAVIQDDDNWLVFIRQLGSFMNVTDNLSTCFCTPDTCTADFTIDNGNWNTVNGNASYDEGIGWESGPGGAQNHICHIEHIKGAEFGLFLMRIQLHNFEPTNNIDVRIQTRDDGGVVEQETAVLAQGEQTVVFFFTLSSAIKRVQLRFIRQGLETELKMHIQKVEFIIGDCVLPDQPV